jgi:hypothetical protein
MTDIYLDSTLAYGRDDATAYGCKEKPCGSWEHLDSVRGTNCFQEKMSGSQERALRS